MVINTDRFLYRTHETTSMIINTTTKEKKSETFCFCAAFSKPEHIIPAFLQKDIGFSYAGDMIN